MKKEKIKNIWHKYQKVLLLSFFFFLFCYGIKLFTYSYSLDTEAFMIYRESFLNSWLQLNRFSLVALKEIFSFIPFNIYVTNWITVIIFFCASLLTYYNLARIYLKMKSPKKALLFLMILGSSPIFLEQFNFTLQSAEIAIFLLLFQLGVLSLEKYFEKNKISYLICTIFIESLCLGAYQSFAPLFITEILIVLLLKLENKEITSKKSIIKYIATVCGAFIISFMLYVILSKLILELSGLSSSTYLNSQIAWISKPFFENCINILKSIAMMYFSFGYLRNSYFQYTLLNSFVLLLGIIMSIKKIKEKKYFSSILCLAILASPLLMTFLLGNHEPVRAQFALPIVLAFFPIYTWKEKKWFSVALLILIFGQVFTMWTLQYNDYLRFENDKIMAKEIYEEVKEYLPNRKLVFVGAKDSDNKGNIKIRGEAMGISFFNHYGLSDRATTFMKTLGYPIEDDRNYILEATEVVKDLEAYPSKNSIYINDTYVIVKLS